MALELARLGLVLLLPLGGLIALACGDDDDDGRGGRRRSGLRCG